MVLTRSAQKRKILPNESPVKRSVTLKRNFGTRATPLTRATTTTTSTNTTITTPVRQCRRALMDEFDAAADGVKVQSSVEVNSKIKEIDPGLTMTPPATPEPEEMNCDSSSSPECSPVKCNPLSEAKRLLSIGAVDGVVGRDREMFDLSHCLEKCLDTQSSSTIFISGPPGTGKTLTVQSILTKLSNAYSFVNLFYNTMDFRRGSTIYTKIADDLKLPTDKTRFRDKLIASIERFITNSKKMVILIIDEIDKMDKDLVDAMLDWPKAKRSKLILIGIANTITSSSLNKMTCTFEQNSIKKISFRPYTKEQIIDIIQSRLKYIMKTCELISPPALSFCAAKVSVYSGDARKALDIVRKAIELAEREKCYTHAFSGLKITSDDGDNIGSPRKMARMSPLKSPRRSPRKGINFDTSKPLVEPRHIMTVLDSVFGNKLFSDKNTTELTMHQQIILCCILCHGREKQNKEMTIPTLFKLFTKSCNVIKVSSNQLTNSDFLCICQILESIGLVRIKQAKEMRLTKITLSVNEDEVAQRISEKSLIQSLMKNIHSIL